MIHFDTCGPTWHVLKTRWPHLLSILHVVPKAACLRRRPTHPFTLKISIQRLRSQVCILCSHCSELRRQLYSLFGSYGKVLDVVATRADGMRGQAFIVFRDLQSATAALRALDGFEFYEKPLVCESRAHSRSWNMHEHDPRLLL